MERYTHKLGDVSDKIRMTDQLFSVLLELWQKGVYSWPEILCLNGGTELFGSSVDSGWSINSIRASRGTDIL